MRTMEIKVLKFEELDDQAKEKAREWFRQCCQYDEWWENVYEDAARMAEMFGLDINTRRVHLMGGGHRYDPNIYFSGFSSQGDGACFEGEYRYKKGALKAVINEAPEEKELHEVVSTLQQIQRLNFYKIFCRTEHRGHYYHSGCMDVECENLDDSYRTVVAEEDFVQCMRDFADWIYKRLEDEYEYLMSDDSVDENIIINEYEFDEEGERI